jgi:hypothetical protein
VQVADETEVDLRHLIESDFGSLPTDGLTEAAVIDWLHYVARRVPQRPRAVVESTEVVAASAKYSAIELIARQLRNGGDVSPWLHDKIRKAKADARADMMFNDWQILHFHLGTVFESSTKVKRSEELLFSYITADKAILLDVHRHGAWAMRDLLRVLARTAPLTMARYELKGIWPGQRGYTDNGYQKLRESGLTPMLSIDGRLYIPPGLGVTTSRHSTRIVRYAQQLRRATHELLECVRTNTLPQNFARELYSNLACPVRLGLLFEAGSFVFYDKNRQLPLMQMPCIE